jgi:hypothetical protein
MDTYGMLKAIGSIAEEVQQLEDLLSGAAYLTSPRYQGDALIKDRILWIVWRIEQAKQVVSKLTDNASNSTKNDNKTPNPSA